MIKKSDGTSVVIDALGSKSEPLIVKDLEPLLVQHFNLSNVHSISLICQGKKLKEEDIIREVAPEGATMHLMILPSKWGSW